MKKIALSITILLLASFGAEAQSTLRQPVLSSSTSSLAVTYTGGTINNGGHAVTIAASSVNVTASKTDCAAPTYTSCNLIYANSSGTVANTSTLGTAAASGNTLLGIAETDGTGVTRLVFPLQNGQLTIAGLGFLSSSTITTSADITTTGGKFITGTAGSSVGGVQFFNATSGSITLAPTTGALGAVTLTMPATTGTLALLVSPSFTTPNIGAATGTSLSVSGSLTSTVATGTAPVIATSTTISTNLHAYAAAYNAAGTQQTLGHVVFGKCTLGTDCAVTLAGSAAFTGTTTYFCSGTDQTSAAAVKVVNTAGGTVTFTGTGTDVISYVCYGN